MMNNYITYMWREAPNIREDKVYRFQTNDSKINTKRLSTSSSWN